MTMLTIIGLFLSCFWMNATVIHQLQQVDFHLQHASSMPVIDSADTIIINLDLALVIGQIIEVPVFIQTDEVINALDFSMILNQENLEFESVVDHTGSLQYAAHFNPDDLKLRFTSNSFSSYPVDPVKVVSIRIRVLGGAVFPGDIQSIIGYLNGDRCTALLKFSGKVLPVSNKEITTDEIFITPNPATDQLYIQSDASGTLDVFDTQGRKAITSYIISAGHVNKIDVQTLPRGTYTLHLVTTGDKVKIQRIVLL